MKKVIFFLSVWSFSFGALKAQTWAEWWQQKKTQIKYLVQQIGALEVYAGYLQKGHHIAQQGLTAIGDIKNGDFNIHQNFFNSLMNVNPKIKNAAEVGEIIALQISIVEQFKKTINNCRGSGQYNRNELGYFGEVYSGLVADCMNDLDALITLTTDGQTQMTDDERMRRIQVLYGEMQEKYAFTQSFGNDTSVLALQREKEANEAALVKTLYGLQ